ncbi:hypothetical protein LVJ94_23950 [Pendulispora rubella]|uniref:ASCH domain-containing protein n=1 Tax=Pendulispora rubella TaxID=2741070 RepID=A0ABZ2LH48_9BACT
MLFKDRFLQGFADGTITRAYRRWDKPRVKAGSHLRTPIGVLAVEAIDEVASKSLTDADARAAGYASRDELLAELRAYGEGTLYAIALRLDGADPRIALRERASLEPEERAELQRRLERLDATSRHGPWTERVLRVIHEHPEGTRAVELAAAIERDTPSFKLDVRKLKELGLTESLGTGYRISPRGRAFLEAYVDGPKKRR